jgi:dTDP-L-rhamnose 4-epimerase
MQNILLIGGAGFIGSHTVDFLINNDVNVTVVDSLEKECHGADFINRQNIKAIYNRIPANEITPEMLMTDAIIICASTPTQDYSGNFTDYMEKEIGVCTHIFDTIVNNGLQSAVGKIVLVSSREVYGEGIYFCPNCDRRRVIFRNSLREKNCPVCLNPMNIDVTDEMKLTVPVSKEGVICRAREDVLTVLNNLYEVPVTILRIWDVYGSRQHRNAGIVGKMLWDMLDGNDIKVPEDGNLLRNFIHVSDVAKAVYVACAESDMVGVFNIGNYARATLETMGLMIHRLLNSQYDGKVVLTGKRELVGHCIPDVRKARRFGYKAKIGFPSGLEELKLWLEEIGKLDRV